MTANEPTQPLCPSGWFPLEDGLCYSFIPCDHPDFDGTEPCNVYVSATDPNWDRPYDSYDATTVQILAGPELPATGAVTDGIIFAAVAVWFAGFALLSFSKVGK